ncbi:interleukin-18 receptor 1-like [Callorhinchus milii]|uniref:interleukin-18 receptor 1-like n=1 Tax=Callorhinchus milii TaxID=7868 RepID=UPI001C3F7111|nr:interleukin-18 receptor 1-like [Callorhinchus milii]
MDNNDLQTYGLNITWFKDTSEHGPMELRLGEKRRITSEGTLLEFWPVMVNDTGKYSCHLFNGSHDVGQMKTSLTVARSDEACYDEGHLYEQTCHVGVSITLPCPDMNAYKDNEENIVWYKDCQTQVHTGAFYLIEKLEKDNAGYYTCKLSLDNAGIQYNITRTWNLTLEDAIDLSKPKLVYPHQERIVVDIGENRTFECKVVAQPDDLIQIAWKSNGTLIKDCNQNESVCTRKTLEGSGIIVKPLVFNSIKKEHLNRPFKCILSLEGSLTHGQIILQEKENSDIGRIIKPLFGVIVIIIIVAALCIQYKVEIVLLFRELMGSDETLGDGKEYDAYVLLLKSGKTLVNAEEEQQFALELLPSVLEQQFGYQLCIFERDAPPGGASADYVLLSIKKCRRLIIILSDEWIAADDSSMYELMTGLHQALVERIIKPILIEFKPIKNYKILPESLQLICKSKKMVKWRGTKSVSKKSYFWKKMRYLMPAKLANYSEHETETLGKKL